MATISLTYTVSPADQARVVAAFQIDANADLNATATPAQVLAYIQKLVKSQIIARVLAFENTAAVAAIVPQSPPVMT